MWLLYRRSFADRYIEDNELYVTAVPDTYEPGFMEEFVQINYCPMCGEKLVHEETECAGG